MTLLDVIPIGHANAQPKRVLAARAGVTTRDFEAAVEQLRKSGRGAICSDASGYWQPLTSAELAANLDRRRRRALSQLVTVRGERRFARQWAAREALPLAFAWEAA